jgi:hypothetical protein
MHCGHFVAKTLPGLFNEPSQRTAKGLKNFDNRNIRQLFVS